MSERGSVTIWVLGLAMAVLTVGVLAVDLWDLAAHRRELAVIADSAAVAGASAIDEARWRAGEGLVLDPGLVERRVRAVLDAHQEVAAGIDLAPGWLEVDVTAGLVRVSLATSVDASLLGLAGRGATVVGASSEATAVRR